MKKETQATSRVRIVGVPDGEAPQWVRQAWVGLELPCDPFLGYPDGGLDRGVATGKPVRQNQRGVSVPQDQALAALQESNPNAAAWWKAYGYPHAEESFGFEEEVIELVSGVTRQRIVHVPDDVMGQPLR